MIKKCLTFLLLITVLTFASEPVSKQARLIDASSGAEVIIEATGIYQSKKRFGAKKEIKKIGVDLASLDARKAAVYFVLQGGTDPLLSTKEERENFDKIKQSFFIDQTINQFIAYEEEYPKKTVLLNNGKGIKIVKDIKVNRSLLTQYLEDNKIIMPRKEISDWIGNPMIMVVNKNKSTDNQAVNHAKTVIQSLLTEKKYDVVLGDQQKFLNELVKTEKTIKNQSEDLSYQLALTVGSDVYIDFDVQKTKEAYNTQKYAVTLRAFETTTGRLIGSETGYSNARQADDYVSIEEALLSAVNNVLTRINNYWKEDIENGIQYKVIFNIIANLNQEIKEEMVDDLLDKIENIANKSKENIITNQTIDLILWCDPKKYNKPRKLWRAIKKSMSEDHQEIRLNLENQNRKLLQISVNAN